MSDVIIVGGGLAGLCAARALHEQGVGFQLYEAADDVGGRVRTDNVDGFLLDRGFQVLLTAYPEAKRILDYDALDLQYFYPGALVRYDQQFHLVSDPLRRPLDMWATLCNPVGSLVDKVRVGLLRRTARRSSPEAPFEGNDVRTVQALYGGGFSESMVERFFRPFLGGVFLDRELRTSSRMFRFVFQMFATGPTAVPRLGMGAIPAQLRRALPERCIHVNAPVKQIHRDEVVLSNGNRVPARCVIVATDMDTAGRWLPDIHRRAWSSTICFYFDAPKAPVNKPILVLNGEEQPCLNNLHVVSQVNPGSAPEGRSLISVTVVGSQDGVAEAERAVRCELRAWYGESTDAWRTLHAYVIPRALPRQEPGVLEPPERSVRTVSGVYVCGDHIDQASIQGAMVSGRRAAEAVLADGAR